MLDGSLRIFVGSPAEAVSLGHADGHGDGYGDGWGDGEGGGRGGGSEDGSGMEADE